MPANRLEKYMKTQIFLICFALSGLVHLPLLSSAQTLESELDSLNLEKTEKVPEGSTKERLYSIQSRITELKNRVEILAGGGQNFSGDSFLQSRQMSLEGQFHFNDSWSAALAYSQLDNQWTNSTQQLINQKSLVPDVDYTTSRTEARVQYNTFYGKLRWQRDSVLYFDQYISLGYAWNNLASGTSPGPVADIGFAHWISNWGTVHWGVKDYYYQENGQLSSGYNNNIFGYLEVGYLFK